MRNKGIALLLICMGLMGCDGEKEKNQEGGKTSMAVDYVVVEPRPVANEVNVTGTLLPAESAMMTTRASGLVEKILFEEGQEVRKGQLLARLDDRQWLARRQSLVAELEVAEKDLRRKEQLAEINGVSAADLEAATLRVSTLKADKQELDVLIDYASIHAPFSGRIGLRSISQGSYISPGDPVAQLVQTHPLKLEFNIPERYAGQVKTGQKLRFTTAGIDSVFIGKIYATEPSISETSRALKVRATVPNPENLLIPGAFVAVNLILDTIPDAMLVPTEALVPKLSEQIVYTIRGGVLRETPVQQGIRLPRLIQLEKGLNAGDTVIVTGILQAEDSLAVRAGTEISISKLEEEK